MAELESDHEHRAHKFVGQLYRAILNRDPDPAGLNGYVQAMLSGRTEEELIRNFLSGNEYQASLSRNGMGDPAGLNNTITSKFPIDYQPPGEAGRCYAQRVRNGFLDKYCSGDLVLDVGFSGYDNPLLKTSIPGAIGIDLDYPGYDGLHLPFADNSVDTIISSHCLEHILYDYSAIRDWYRTVKIDGFIVCFVPHQGLYEKKRFLPSLWNQDHKRMYTPASLLESFETVLELNSYRVRHLADNDAGFNYDLGPDSHSDGAYEIELVIQKIKTPTWTLA